MVTISVCVGSGCHKRGSYAMLNRLKELCVIYNVQDRVTVVPAFCFGECSRSPNIKIDDKLYSGVPVEDMERVFKTCVLNKLN